jgi:hypothetical protein
LTSHINQSIGIAGTSLLSSDLRFLLGFFGLSGQAATSASHTEEGIIRACTFFLMFFEHFTSMEPDCGDGLDFSDVVAWKKDLKHHRAIQFKFAVRGNFQDGPLLEYVEVGVFNQSNLVTFHEWHHVLRSLCPVEMSKVFMTSSS